ncbi:MAG: hypothetical protein GX241_01510 [Ruminococcaceae bacterium]|nr:hypothetical protein [Oscillospiraceae bacterium]
MVSKKDSILALLKSSEPTMVAAGLNLTGPAKPGEDEADITFEGELGEVVLKLEENILKILCKKNDGDFRTVSQTLFDYEDENWEARDTKSVANEVAESISSFFGTELIYDSTKSDKTTKNKNLTPELEEFLQSGKKKKSKRESTISYEAENLAHRMENIFPELKGELDKNIEEYEMFLPEAYFEKLATPLILNAIRKKDRQTLKKIFNAFNIFYDEGPSDIQSLIVVSILGINFVADETLFEKSSEFMSEVLLEAVESVVSFLKTGKGKRQMQIILNPQPYKSKRLK